MRETTDQKKKTDRVE